MDEVLGAYVYVARLGWAMRNVSQLHGGPRSSSPRALMHHPYSRAKITANMKLLLNFH